jgi:uncharacterized membrane protein (GlpM family)
MIPLRDPVHANRWSAINYALIAANVWVFLYEVALGCALEPCIHRWPAS